MDDHKKWHTNFQIYSKISLAAIVEYLHGEFLDEKKNLKLISSFPELYSG